MSNKALFATFVIGSVCLLLTIGNVFSYVSSVVAILILVVGEYVEPRLNARALMAVRVVFVSSVLFCLTSGFVGAHGQRIVDSASSVIVSDVHNTLREQGAVGKNLSKGFDGSSGLFIVEYRGVDALSAKAADVAATLVQRLYDGLQSAFWRILVVVLIPVFGVLFIVTVMPPVGGE